MTTCVVNPVEISPKTGRVLSGILIETDLAILKRDGFKIETESVTSDGYYIKITWPDGKDYQRFYLDADDCPANVEKFLIFLTP